MVATNPELSEGAPEKRKRGRSKKELPEDGDNKKKAKVDDAVVVEESSTKDDCSVTEPMVKVASEDIKEDLVSKSTTSNDEGNVTGQSESEFEDDEPRLGVLVIWEGGPHEPLFKKKLEKPGRFYIVNCGEAKGLSSNNNNNNNSCHNNTKGGQESNSNNCSENSASAPGGDGLATTEGSSNDNNPKHNNNNSVSGQQAPCSCCASGCHGGIITGETSKRVSRRRPKGPKKVQLVTKEEHHKILNSYIAEKKYEPDFKVDSLFANQVDQSGEHQGSNNNGGRSDPAPTSRRTRLNNNSKMGASKQKKQQQQHQTQHHHHPQSLLEEEHVVSFTVRGNPELVDDVAGYEMVDSNNQLDASNEGQSCNGGEQLNNHEFGIQLSHEDGLLLLNNNNNNNGDGRQKRPYRMRKVPTKEVPGEITCDATGKPRCTYTDLIEKALLQSNGGLTVSEIYNWISTNYPYFQANDDRWKNSVRHNLSINPYFKKGDKARNGAGHLWVISEDGKGIRPPIRRKSGSDNILDSICIENGDVIPIRNETDRAISVILSEYAMASMQTQQNHQQQQQHQHHHPHHHDLHHQQLNNNNNDDELLEGDDEAETAVTYIQIPNEIAIGSNDEVTGQQVICYEDLPDGSYTIDVQDSSGIQSEQVYTLSDFSDANVIIVNADEANKENMHEQHHILDDMVVPDFGVITENGMMTHNGRMSAPPMDSITGFEDPHTSQEMILDTNSMGLTDPPLHQDLTLLNTLSAAGVVGVGESEAMDTMSVVGVGGGNNVSSQDTQVIEIIGDHLFDTKELGMIYEYDHQGDPLYL